MSDIAIQHELLRAAVDRLPADRLSSVRQAALSQFSACGFPTARHEDWRYTNLAPAIERSNAWLRDAATVQEYRQVELPTPAIDAYWIPIANGVAGDIPPELGELGITVRRLSDAGADSTLDTSEAMSSFNAALLRDGLKLTVGRDVRVEKPIGFLITDDSDTQIRLSQVRIIIEVGQHSHIRLIENYPRTESSNGFTNAVMQLELAPQARADYLRLQDCHSQHIQIGRLVARLERDTALHYLSLDFGGGLVRSDVEVDIAGVGAEVSLHGLTLAAGRQHIDSHTRVDHRVGPATSTEEFRSIVNDRARFVFNGKAVVHAGADGTDAHQANHNLLLSGQAEVDTKPELEIYADDVKCSHGATVGQLDELALFYLRSRGLDREQATRMLTGAFAASILSSLPIESVREALEDLLLKRLEKLTAGDLS